MGEREDHQASTESRRDVGARPPTRHGHEEQIQRYLGAALYGDLKEEGGTEAQRKARVRKEKLTGHKPSEEAADEPEKPTDQDKTED